MKSNTFKFAGLLALSLTVAGCASGPGGGSIYVPAGDRSSPDEAPQPPQTGEPRDEPRVERKSEQPDQPVRQPQIFRAASRLTAFREPWAAAEQENADRRRADDAAADGLVAAAAAAAEKELAPVAQ